MEIAVLERHAAPPPLGEGGGDLVECSQERGEGSGQRCAALRAISIGTTATIQPTAFPRPSQGERNSHARSNQEICSSGDPRAVEHDDTEISLDSDVANSGWNCNSNDGGGTQRDAAESRSRDQRSIPFRRPEGPHSRITRIK
jgi:hypothetical protein